MILLVLLSPPELPLLLDELSEAAEGSGLDVVITEVWVTMIVRPFATELNVVVTAEDAAKVVLLVSSDRDRVVVCSVEDAVCRVDDEVVCSVVSDVV